jgi:hypothetical protein
MRVSSVVVVASEHREFRLGGAAAFFVVGSVIVGILKNNLFTVLRQKLILWHGR